METASRRYATYADRTVDGGASTNRAIYGLVAPLRPCGLAVAMRF